MTGKESIKSIKNYIKNFACNYEKDYTPFDPEKFYLKTWIESIEKDLELLDILKKVKLDYDVEAIPTTITVSGTITREELKKIEEWYKKMTTLITMNDKEYEALRSILERNGYELIEENDTESEVFIHYTYQFNHNKFVDYIKVWHFRGYGRKEDDKT